MQKILVVLLFVVVSWCLTACQNVGIGYGEDQSKLLWEEHVNSNVSSYREYYKQAKVFVAEKRYQEAYDVLNKIPESYTIIGDYVLFYRAEAAANIPQESVTIESLQKLIDHYPHSVLVEEAYYKLAQAYTRIKDTKNAKKHFDFIVTNFPASKYALGSLYYLGNLAIQDGNFEEAMRLWTQYLVQAPDGMFSLEIAQNSEDKSFPLSPELSSGLGLAFFYAHDYPKALHYLKDHINEKNWYVLAKTYEQLGRKQEALKTYQGGLLKFPDHSPFYREALSAIDVLDNHESKVSWRNNYSRFRSYGDFSLWKLAALENGATKYNLYQKIFQEYPKGDYAPESSWKLFWKDYLEGRILQAVDRGKKHVILYSSSKSVPAMYFWLGKAYDRLGDKSSSSIYYTTVSKEFPRHYYGFRAKYILENGSSTEWMYLDNEPEEFALESSPPYTYSAIGKAYGAQYAELAYLQQFDDLAKALTLFKNPVMESWIYKELEDKGKSILIAREHFGYKGYQDYPTILKLLYPVYYADLITHFSNQYGLNILLVTALTKEESYFNPIAVSSSQAMGLMQLLPSTAGDVAKWEKMPFFAQVDLFNPEKNIRLGSRYLRYLHTKFDNNSVLSVAAYNGGPGSVERWLTSIAHEDYDQFIENIPYDQTRYYVFKVMGSYWNYHRLYGLSD